MTPALLLCAVLSIHDGDSLRVSCDGGPSLPIRVADVDAPEIAGCGPWKAARDTLRGLAGDAVWIAPRYQDRFGRLVADVATVEHEDIAAEMVAAGMARRWPHHDTGRAMTPRPEWRC